jgi:predicted nucleotidyltransferase
MNGSGSAARFQLDPTRLARLCTSHGVSRLWLFGSVLRPDFRPESDIDVLVEFEPGAHIGLLALARLRRELSELFARNVDLVPVGGLKPAIRDDVLGTRELLYAA